MHGVMTELNFASYAGAIHPALLKHSEKEDAALFLLASGSSGMMRRIHRRLDPSMQMNRSKRS